MITLGNICGHPPEKRTFSSSDLLVDSEVYVGVEIELENMLHFNPYYLLLMKDSFWETVGDGSLRNNGIELILSHYGTPIKGFDIITALNAFDKAIKNYIKDGHLPEITSRTSTHIHLDVRDLSQEELIKLILIYCVFEEILFKTYDESRVNNIYCKPIFCTRELQDNIGKLISSQTTTSILSILNTQHKYNAVNLLSITNKGSLEFRLFPATFEKEQVLEWINLILCLKVSAKDPTISIDSFPERVSGEGLQPFLFSIFGKYSNVLIEQATDLRILQGTRVAQEILNIEKYKLRSKGYMKFANSKKINTLLKTFAKTNHIEIEME